MSDFEGDERREYETDLGDSGVDDDPQAQWSGAATNYMSEYDQGREGGRTRYEDRDTLDDRASYADQGRVIGPDGDFMTGTYGWVVDDDSGYLLFLPPDQIVIHFPDGHDEALTRDGFMARRLEFRTIGCAW